MDRNMVPYTVGGGGERGVWERERMGESGERKDKKKIKITKGTDSLVVQ